MNLSQNAHFVNNGLWEEGAEYLQSKAQSLECVGADFITCVSNRGHQLADKFMAGISVPLLHIAEPTDKAIKAQGLQKVALMGTKTNHVNDSMHYITLA